MRKVSRLKTKVILAMSLLISTVLIIGSTNASATVPYITERVNLTPSSTQSTTSGNVQDAPVLSQDGRYVAFATSASDIVAGDTNNSPDIFVRDRKLGATVRANLTNSGAELPTGYGGSYKMSANGRFVLFTYRDSPLYVNNKWQLYLRDLKNNSTERVSITATGGIPDNSISFFDISADGRYVVFTTGATNVVSGDTNNALDIFVRDRKLGTTALLSKPNSGGIADGSSSKPSISCDGSYVVFSSQATNLVTGDTNGAQDLFLVDRIANNTISNLTINGNSTNGSNVSGDVDISCNGERVVFISHASNLVLGDTNNERDVFAYSMVNNSFERVNVDSSGNQTSGSTLYGLSTNSIDFSGRYVAFVAGDDSLVTGDTNGTGDVFLRDIIDGTTQIISKRDASTQTTYNGSTYYTISLDGREVAFPSADTGLVSGDTNGTSDIFVSKTGI